ncbi:MAG: MoaD/ThiS family protein [Promethearchaeota archaeon]
MKIEVLYFADFKDITGKDREILEIRNDNSLKGIIELLMEKYPMIEKLLWNNDTQNFNESVSIILNHESLSSNISLASSLSDGDKIAFLLPISGG